VLRAVLFQVVFLYGSALLFARGATSKGGVILGTVLDFDAASRASALVKCLSCVAHFDGGQMGIQISGRVTGTHQERGNITSKWLLETKHTLLRVTR
jgi:hypothetical protein